MLGDIAQATSPWSAADWPTLLGHLGIPDATLAVLDCGFRAPAQIIDCAARLLPQIAPELDPPTSLRHTPGALHHARTTAAALPDTLVQTCRYALKNDGSVGLIAADTDLATLRQRLAAEDLDVAMLGDAEDAMDTTRLVCVPASLANGLEFDTVIVVEPARIADAEPRGTNRLYVALTRAVTSLHILHAEPLPAALRIPSAPPAIT